MAKTIQSGDILLGLDNQNTNLIYRRKKNGELSFVRYCKQTFDANLMLVDSRMPELIASILPWIEEQQGVSFYETASYLENNNPYNYPPDFSHRIYPHHLSSLAAYAAMGLPVNIEWDGYFKESFILIQSKGEVKLYPKTVLIYQRILFPYCRFYTKKEEKGNTIKLKLIIKYEEQESTI